MRTIFIHELRRIVRRTSERVSSAVLHDERIIKIVQTNQPRIICLLYECKDECVEIRIYDTDGQPAKMSANQNAHATFFTCEKIVQPIKTLLRQISHVKNIVCNEMLILFQPNTTRQSLYKHGSDHEVHLYCVYFCVKNFLLYY